PPSGPYFCPGAAGGGLPSRGSEPCRFEFRNSRVYLRGSGHGHAAAARDLSRSTAAGPLLSRLDFGDLWARGGIAPDRRDTAKAGQPVRLRESFRDPFGAGL